MNNINPNDRWTERQDEMGEIKNAMWHETNEIVIKGYVNQPKRALDIGFPCAPVYARRWTREGLLLHVAATFSRWEYVDTMKTKVSARRDSLIGLVQIRVERWEGRRRDIDSELAGVVIDEVARACIARHCQYRRHCETVYWASGRFPVHVVYMK